MKAWNEGSGATEENRRIPAAADFLLTTADHQWGGGCSMNGWVLCLYPSIFGLKIDPLENLVLGHHCLSPFV